MAGLVDSSSKCGWRGGGRGRSCHFQEIGDTSIYTMNLSYSRAIEVREGVCFNIVNLPFGPLLRLAKNI